MKASYIVSSLVALLVIAFGAWISGGSITLFFDLPSLVLVLTIPGVLLVGGFGFRGIAEAFSAALDPDTPAGTAVEKLRRAVLFFKALRNYLMITGALGTIMGVVSVLSHLSDPQAMGRGIACATLILLYAILLTGLVALPLRTAAEKRLAGTGEPVRSR